MRLRRIAGAAAALTVVAGGGLLLSGPTHAATPLPVVLDATGMSSSSCPLPLNGSIAVTPNTTVQFKPGLVLSLGQSMTLTVLSKAATNPAPTPKTYPVPSAGVNILFASTQTYDLTWKTNGVLGVAGFTQTGKLTVSQSVSKCQVAVHVPVPSVSVPVVPSPITSAINGAVSSAVSGVNGALSPVNSILPPLPTVPGVSGLPSVPGLPGGSGSSSGGGSQSGVPVPGTTYRPHGPTVADRTVPKGYGSGSGQGGVYVPANGSSINASPLPGAGTGSQAGGKSASSSAVKSGGAPRTVELATSRPRSALGALPTLAVILAILALSGTTAFYARTFLLQPAPAVARVTKPRS